MAYLGDVAPGGDVRKLGGVYNVFGDLGSTLGPLVALPLTGFVTVSQEYLLCVLVVGLTAGVVLLTLDGDPSPLRNPEVVPGDD